MKTLLLLQLHAHDAFVFPLLIVESCRKQCDIYPVLQRSRAWCTANEASTLAIATLSMAGVRGGNMSERITRESSGKRGNTDSSAPGRRLLLYMLTRITYGLRSP